MFLPRNRNRQSASPKKAASAEARTKPGSVCSHRASAKLNSENVKGNQMRKILITTALLTAMSTMPVLAQSSMPADFVPPEGYQSAAADTLTFQDLTGATVYDTRGESIGDISDFVMAVDPAMGGTTGAATTDTTTATDTTTSTDTTTATDGNVSDGTGGTDATATDSTGTAATDSTATTEGTGTVATDSTATGTEGTSATDSTATTTESTGTAATDSTTTATEGTGTDVAATDATDGTMTGTGAEGEMTGSISGQVSHAIIDVGGFLGMGTHTVAIPIEALQVYRGSSATDVRVYLPWSEDQLKQIPEYVQNDPSTLGTMQSVNP
jgi:hypothetical protein